MNFEDDIELGKIYTDIKDVISKGIPIIPVICELRPEIKNAEVIKFTCVRDDHNAHITVEYQGRHTYTCQYDLLKTFDRNNADDVESWMEILQVLEQRTRLRASTSITIISLKLIKADLYRWMKGGDSEALSFNELEELFSRFPPSSTSWLLNHCGLNTTIMDKFKNSIVIFKSFKCHDVTGIDTFVNGERYALSIDAVESTGNFDKAAHVRALLFLHGLSIPEVIEKTQHEPLILSTNPTVKLPKFPSNTPIDDIVLHIGRFDYNFEKPKHDNHMFNAHINPFVDGPVTGIPAVEAHIRERLEQYTVDRLKNATDLVVKHGLRNEAALTDLDMAAVKYLKQRNKL